ncbi:hypothetical protein RIF29_31315 [Crotalaria pallida]|uniref:Uncharacterized protein n=1 Tax=Crotalaria pallida TaxID=3830 RepID=A0AAN9HX52_CROPI
MFTSRASILFSLGYGATPAGRPLLLSASSVGSDQMSRISDKSDPGLKFQERENSREKEKRKILERERKKTRSVSTFEFLREKVRSDRNQGKRVSKP